MSTPLEFDLLVVGAGPGGYVCAIWAAKLGLKVACVEKSKTLGGTCLNVGCIPSKALLESSHHYSQAKEELKEHGIEFKDLTLNLTQMLKRKEKVVQANTSGVEFLFRKNKVTLLQGTAKIADSSHLDVTNEDKTTTYKFKNLVIATGSIASEIPALPFDHQFIVDSTDALSFQNVPENLLVVGGGVIGLELGSVWNRLGSKVKVIEAMDGILGATDKAIARTMQKLLQKQGLEIFLQTKVQKAEIKNSKVELQCLNANNDPISFNADKVLVAVGRKPNTKDLGLDAVGIKVDKRGFIETSDNFLTSVACIYAIGDATLGPMLAHKAEEEGVAVAEIIAGKVHPNKPRAIPSIVYTWPELACLGLSEEQCKEKAIPYKVGSFFFKGNGRAKAMGCDDGMVKMLSHSVSDEILGVHIVGPMASELIAELVLAFEYKASSEDIARTIHAHPTLSEAIKEAALSVDNRAIHA